MNRKFPVLTQSEASEIRAAIREVTEDGSQQLSFHELLRRWEALVQEVERAYKLTAYDYMNDLAVRDRLEQIAPLLSPGLRRKMNVTLAPLDERFRIATVSADKPLGNKPYFWWKRIPRSRDPEFDETI